eukprot:ANDGO_07413.mRNA.1 hypothetical protein
MWQSILGKLSSPFVQCALTGVTGICIGFALCLHTDVILLEELDRLNKFSGVRNSLHNKYLMYAQKLLRSEAEGRFKVTLQYACENARPGLSITALKGNAEQFVSPATPVSILGQTLVLRSFKDKFSVALLEDYRKAESKWKESFRLNEPTLPGLANITAEMKEEALREVGVYDNSARAVFVESGFRKLLHYVPNDDWYSRKFNCHRNMGTTSKKFT